MAINEAEWEALSRRARRDPQSIGPAFAELMAKLEPEDGAFASGFYRRLTEWIQRFEEELDAEHEVGVRLVTFGQAVTFHLENISYWNPSLILFQGSTEAGEPVQLIQHVSQISLLLMKLPRTAPAGPKRRIGFSVANPTGV